MISCLQCTPSRKDGALDVAGIIQDMLCPCIIILYKTHTPFGALVYCLLRGGQANKPAMYMMCVQGKKRESYNGTCRGADCAYFCIQLVEPKPAPCELAGTDARSVLLTVKFLVGGGTETKLLVATRVTGSRCSSHLMRTSSILHNAWGDRAHKSVARLRRH